MPIYKTQGTLTGTIEAENVGLAQAYLTQDDMTPYVHKHSDVPQPQDIEHIEWKLDGDGHKWEVTVFATRELSEPQLKELSSWVSGQNSDGLGEGFEQQEFAEGECGDCEGCIDAARGWGGTCDEGSMISFDWETNDCAFTRVK